MADLRDKAITVTAAQLEELAFEGGYTIERRGDKMQLVMPSGRRFEADLPPVPAQREGGDRG